MHTANQTCIVQATSSGKLLILPCPAENAQISYVTEVKKSKIFVQILIHKKTDRTY